MKRTVLRIVDCVLLLLALASVIAAIILFEKGGNTLTWQAHLENTFTVIAIVFGILYMLYGFDHNHKVFYKVFMYAYLVSTAAVAFVAMVDKSGTPVTASIQFTISLIMVTILASGKKNGPTKSKIYALINIVAAFLPMILNLVHFQEYPTFAKYVMCTEFARFLLALTAGTMVVGRYFDKAERHSQEVTAE